MVAVSYQRNTYNIDLEMGVIYSSRGTIVNNEDKIKNIMKLLKRGKKIPEVRKLEFRGEI